MAGSHTRMVSSREPLARLPVGSAHRHHTSSVWPFSVITSCSLGLARSHRHTVLSKLPLANSPEASCVTHITESAWPFDACENHQTKTQNKQRAQLPK